MLFAGEPGYAKRSSAFNADYYGAIIRAYFDGKVALKLPMPGSMRLPWSP